MVERIKVPILKKSKENKLAWKLETFSGGYVLYNNGWLYHSHLQETISEKKIKIKLHFPFAAPALIIVNWPTLSKWFHSIRSLKSLISAGFSVIVVSPCCENSVWSAAGRPGEPLWGRRLALSQCNPAAGRNTTAATSPGRYNLYLPGCGKDYHSLFVLYRIMSYRIILYCFVLCSLCHIISGRIVSFCIVA